MVGDDAIFKKAVDILKSSREKKGLTQTDLANKLNIGLRQYQKIEKGSFPKFKTDQVRDIDKILNTNIYELIYEHKNPDKIETNYSQIMNQQENNSVYESKNDEATTSILTLVKTNSKLADAQKTVAEGNKRLIDSNADLVSIIKSMHQANWNVSKENPSTGLPDLTNPILKQIAKAGAPAYWPTADAGLLLLDKWLAGGKTIKKE